MANPPKEKFEVDPNPNASHRNGPLADKHQQPLVELEAFNV